MRRKRGRKGSRVKKKGRRSWKVLERARKRGRGKKGGGKREGQEGEDQGSSPRNLCLERTAVRRNRVDSWNTAATRIGRLRAPYRVARMRTPPYDIHQRRPATAVSMPLFIFLLFSRPLALCRCQPSRNPLSLWILSPSQSCSSCLLGCCPISPIPVVGPTTTTRSTYPTRLRRLPTMSFTVPPLWLRWKVSSPSSALPQIGYFYRRAFFLPFVVGNYIGFWAETGVRRVHVHAAFFDLESIRPLVPST